MPLRPAMPESASCTVLCVDDNAAALELRAAILERAGFSVIGLQDERDVLPFLEQTPVDCVVLDYLMPEIRGDRLATMVRERFPELPIILISGAVDDPEDLGGANVFVSKTAGHHRLIEVLDEMSRCWKRDRAA